MSIWKQSEKEKLFISQYRKTIFNIFDIIILALGLEFALAGVCPLFAYVVMTCNKITTLNFHDIDSLIKLVKSFSIFVCFMRPIEIDIIFMGILATLQSKAINKQTKTAAKWPIIIAAVSLLWQLIVFIGIICAFVMLPQLTTMNFSLFLFLTGICLLSIAYTMLDCSFLMKSIVYYNVLTGKTTFDRFKFIK